VQQVYDARAHLHQPVAMPQQLPRIAILRVRYPDPREAIFQQQPQQQLRVLAVGLLLAYSFGADRGCIADPQLILQFVQQTLEPWRSPASLAWRRQRPPAEPLNSALRSTNCRPERRVV
jgi:hypothetical protein